MGLQDRDYMHQRSQVPRGGRPGGDRGPRSHAGGWNIVIALLVLVNLGLLLMPSSPVQHPLLEALRRGLGLSAAPPRSGAGPGDGPSSLAQRCLIDGRWTELPSGRSCLGLAGPGLQPEPTPAATRAWAAPPPMPSPEPQPAPPVPAPALRSPQAGGSARAPATVYLCRSYGGAEFWSTAHCHSHQALILRIESVPVGLSGAQQIDLARRQAGLAEQRNTR